MDSKANLLINKAQNEFFSAQALKKISDDDELKRIFEFPAETTFYSGVISHSYYSIFYSAKSYLVAMSINLKSSQGQHQQVYFEFKKLVEKAIIEKELLKIYEDVKGKAESLLEILRKEKGKRTEFTYETLAQANKQPAEDSLDNALFFITHIKEMILRL